MSGSDLCFWEEYEICKKSNMPIVFSLQSPIPRVRF